MWPILWQCVHDKSTSDTLMFFIRTWGIVNTEAAQICFNKKERWGSAIQSFLVQTCRNHTPCNDAAKLATLKEKTKWVHLKSACYHISYKPMCEWWHHWCGVSYTHAGAPVWPGTKASRLQRAGVWIKRSGCRYTALSVALLPSSVALFMSALAEATSTATLES